MARHHLEKDVLGEEQAVDISGRDQAGDCAGIIFVRGGLHVLVGIPIVHAEHVVFDEGTAFGERGLLTIKAQ